MRDIDYAFEELPITIDGRELFAYGSINVEFFMERADPSTGFKGGAEIYSFGPLHAELFDEDGNLVMVIAEHTGPKVVSFANALDQDRILQACEDSLF